MKKLIKEFYLEQNLESKSSVYDFLSKRLSLTHHELIVQDLRKREKLSSVQIWPEVVLPHLESPLLKESKVILLRLQKPIKWSGEVEKITLIVCIGLKADEQQSIKAEIRQLVSKLADEEMTQKLLQLNLEQLEELL